MKKPDYLFAFLLPGIAGLFSYLCVHLAAFDVGAEVV